jgi:uncharacterized protein (TIGR02246 family)
MASKRLIVLVSLAMAGCAAPPPPEPAAPPDTRAADEAAIRAAAKEWEAAGQAKDVSKFASFYAEQASVLMEDAPDVSGSPTQIAEVMGGMMKDPNFALTFTPTQVVVARSGDLAYDMGTYTLTLTGPDKKPAPESGHYVTVWQKNAEGVWKVVIDAPISDPPAAATP